MTKLSTALLLLVTVLLIGGCYEETGLFGRKVARAAYGAHSKSYEEFKGDPVALATVKTIAFVPFVNVSAEQAFDSMAFTTRMANQMATQGEVRVVYPREMMKLVETENRKAKLHNTRLRERVLMGEDLNKLPRDERTRMRMLDPATNLEDAVKLGRILKADAVVMGTVTDYNPYMRPRMCLTVKLVATGNSDTAAIALSQMTQWGVPRASSTARGVIWFVQQNFDSRDSDTGRNVWVYGMTKHTEDRPTNIESYIACMTQYFDYVGSCMTREVLRARKKAIKESERRAMEEAKRRKLAQKGVQNKIRALTDPHYDVPNAQAVMNRSLGDMRDKGWRPDIYNIEHPGKKRLMNTYVDPKLVQEQIRAMR